jgi:hypothetical protein
MRFFGAFVASVTAAPRLEPAFGPFDQRLVTANRVDLLDRPVLAVRVEVSENTRVGLAALGDLTKRGVHRSHDLDVLLRHRYSESLEGDFGLSGPHRT